MGHVPVKKNTINSDNIKITKAKVKKAKSLTNCFMVKWGKVKCYVYDYTSVIIITGQIILNFIHWE